MLKTYSQNISSFIIKGKFLLFHKNTANDLFYYLLVIKKLYKLLSETFKGFNFIANETKYILEN